MTTASPEQFRPPLEGVVVLDFTRHLSGPFATMLLRDLGATVIKIETGRGDPSRAAGPFQDGDSAYFHPINRGKESVQVDLRDAAQVDRLMELLPKVDCLVENYRPGVMDAMGLGHERVREANPRLIYASCSGFGAEGPYARRPAFDVVVQAMGGVMSVTGRRPGEPTRVGVSQGDIVSGVYLVVGIVSALYRRQDTGQGSYIDLSMLDCQLALVTHALGIRAATGNDPQIIGNRHPAIAPFDVYQASDGWLAITAVTDEAFADLCRVLKIPAVAEEDRFATPDLRLENVDDLTPILGAAVANFETRTLEKALLDCGIPCGPVSTMSDLLADPHLAARGSFGRVAQWGDDGLPVPSLPFRLDRERMVCEEPGPELGSMTLEDLERQLLA